MINPKEFRIGNLVNYMGQVYKVVGIQRSHVYVLYEIKDCSVSRDYFVSKDNLELEPIPLTDKILVKMGACEVRDGEFIISQRMILRTELWYIDYVSRTELKSVHKLQNFIYEFNGEEITLNK